ncbi:MAG: T9SS type B sorting domain-containing protein [Bacteroidota bacterium]
MSGNKTRRLVFVIILAVCSVAVFSAVIRKDLHLNDISFFSSSQGTSNLYQNTATKSNSALNQKLSASQNPMFMTVIQGADEEVGCSDNGFTVARFNLCGDSDDRTISLAGGPYGSVEWQILGGSCTPDVNEDCPNTTTTCYTTVGTGQTFNLDAATIPAGSGTEFRVLVDGLAYYFKVKKSTITQTSIKRDFICGEDGRIQITNLSSAYEFSIDSGLGFGPWQSSPIFENLTPGTYIVKARLENTPNTCEYPYDPIVIEQLDISMDVVLVDALCFGDTGSIEVTVNDVPGPYRYTLLDENGIPQEFTTFITNNPYTFGAVGFGTYSIQVETQQCLGDPLNGIPAPRQDFDVNGDPLVIGDGVTALSASTEVNESLSSVPGCGSPSVDIIVRTSGGTPPYTFTVSDGGNSGGSYATQTTYNVATAGSYDFTITDAVGCEITASADVEELTPPDVSVAGVDGTCTNGGARLNITVIDAKGYNLSFRADPGDPWSNDPILSVSAGTYNSIQVRYEQGGFSCFITLPDVITVTESGAINGADPTWVDLACDGAGGVINGSIDFPGVYTGAGGGPFEFSINGVDFFPQQTFNNLSAGNYAPAVRNGSGCRRDFTAITIADVDPPTDIAFTQSNTNCAANTSDVQLAVTANAAIVSFEVISPVTINNGANDTFVGLTNNVNHVFRVTDANSCIYEENFTPAVISSIRARVKSGGDLRVCPGDSDGEATFIVDGFVNNYTFNINGGTESAPQNDAEVDLTGLADGNYTITVTDADTGCQDTATVTVEEPANPLSLTPDVTDMSCANNNIGRVGANASGGFGSYRYELEWPPASGVPTQGPKSGRVFGNLTAEGTYTLTVTDGEGCTASVTFALAEVDPPTIALGAVDYCFGPGDDGAITVSSTAGSAAIGTHEYRINGGPLQASPTFNGLVPGTYTVQVVDGNNCNDELTVVIPRQLRIELAILAELSCGGLGVGEGDMRIRVREGDISDLTNTQYTIRLNGTPVAGHTGVQLPSANFDYEVPIGGAGDYTVEVTDNNGCTNISPPLTFSPPVNIVATAVSTEPGCGDPNSGFVEILPDVSSGNPPFQTVLAPLGSNLNATDPNNPDPINNIYNYSPRTIYSGLAAGTYEYIVKDSRNCTTVVQTVVVDPDTTNPPDATVAAIPATCSAGGVVSGGINVSTIVDGVPNYTILIEDNFGNELFRFDNVTAPFSFSDPLLVEGNYTVITFDSRGCIDQDQVSIDSIDLQIIPDYSAPLGCNSSGTFQCIDIVGGVAPYEVRLVTDPTSTYGPTNSGPTRHCFSGLIQGASYTVQVRDANGCEYTEVLDVPSSTDALAVTLAIDNATCNGTDVTLDYTVSTTSPSGPYNFEIELINTDTGTVVQDTTLPPSALPSINGSFTVPPGPYTITVRETTNTCDGGASAEAILNEPRVDVISNENANCNEDGQLTIRGSGGTPFPPGSLPNDSPYEYAFREQSNTDPLLYGTDRTINLPGSLTGITYDIFVRDASGCTFQTSATIVQLNPDLPVPNVTVNNQCITGTPPATFQIDVEMPPNIDQPTFTLGGQTITPPYDGINPTIATFNVPSIGVYDIEVVDINGCSVETTAEVFQLLSASGGFSTDPTCEDADGIITIVANGGSGAFTYVLTGTDLNGTPVNITDPNADGIFENIAPGSYQVEVTDNNVTDGVNNCTTTVNNVISAPPVLPAIADTGETDISCNGAADGSISVVMTPGTDSDGIDEFRLYRTTNFPLTGSETPVADNGSGSFNNLDADTYVVEVVTNKGCTDARQVVIDEPPVFEITALDATLVCESGRNRFSTVTISAQIVPGNIGNGAPYGYRLDPADSYQSSPDFDIVDNGSVQNITIYAVDANGCESDFTVTVSPPTDVVPSLTPQSVLTCTNPEVIEISVVGTTEFTVITTAPTGTAIANVNVSGASSTTLNLPDAGDYLFEVQDNNPNGCSYPIPVYTVVAPIFPTVTISEANPVQCDGDNNGGLFVEVADYVGRYDYEVYTVNESGIRSATAVDTGQFDTTNFPDVNGDPALIGGLFAGNYVVDIVSVDDPGCPATSLVATVRGPSGPLVPFAEEIGNVSCNDNTGVIRSNLTGGWDIAPYEYRLLRDNNGDLTVYEDEVVTWGANDRFENLSSGFYRVEFRDVEGCLAFFDVELQPIDPIQAGIREPEGLVCPDGNNAVLEVFDPASGDAITGVAGASGGVPGAGYKYQLIYYAETDPAADPLTLTESSRSGLQDSPTFTGASGGFISAGWYAIEVSSGFGCSGLTTPYYVDPPPPIIPDLVQVQAPGCGGLGQMRLSIENPEVGFAYEYRLAVMAGGDPLDPFVQMEDIGGNPVTQVLIDGVQGFYQYEVRKINATNTCGTIYSNGLTLIDAQDIDLVVNQPDDISCANELDGRIESFSSGGVGFNTYTLYRGDPVDAFSPAASATLIDSNDFGTFEGLNNATDYYLAVTSGLTCQDIEGPFEVGRPDPILFNTVATPISCSGESDGSITIAVTSGGVGLVQFAIGPNFNEFFSDPTTPGTFTFEDLEGAATGREYTILIQDSEGCSETTIVSIIEPDELEVTAVETPEICLGFSDGTAQLSITGGTPFVDGLGVAYYEVSQNSVEDIDFARSDSLFFDNLEGGVDYVFFVRDANGCTANVIVSIEVGVDLNAEAIVEYGCEGIFPNSTARVAPINSASFSDVLFSLDVDDITIATEERQWADLPAGDHVVYLYHPNGCNTLVNFTIDAYEPLVVEAAKTGPDEITVTATGGFGGYEYFFNDTSQGGDNIFNISFDAIVDIMVRDSRGCLVQIAFPFDFEGMPEFPDFFTPDGNGTNDTWFPRNREFFPNIEVIIYDRYGRVVAELDQVKEWDGNYEGNPLPTGDYWYVVNANDLEKQQFVGHFTLYR